MKNKGVLIVMLLAVLAVITSCTKEKQYETADEWVAELVQKTTAIQVEELKQKIDDFEMFYLLDVREPQEHYPGFIPGSVNVPAGVLIFKMQNDGFWESQMSYTPQKEDEIIVFCKKGKRSVMAAESLQRLGYANVKYLDGGWKKWEITYPLEYDKSLDKLNHSEPSGEVGGC